jgi:hypothetical protein
VTTAAGLELLAVGVLGDTIVPSRDEIISMQVDRRQEGEGTMSPKGTYWCGETRSRCC